MTNLEVSTRIIDYLCDRPKFQTKSITAWFTPDQDIYEPGESVNITIGQNGDISMGDTSLGYSHIKPDSQDKSLSSVLLLTKLLDEKIITFINPIEITDIIKKSH